MNQFEWEAIVALISAVIIGMFGHNVIEAGFAAILMFG